VKVCGVTTPEAAREICDAGVDALGCVFTESPRRVGIDAARAIAAVIPPFVTRVAVFRHPRPDEIEAVLAAFGPHLVQVEPDDRLPDLSRGASRYLPVFHDGDHVADEIERFVAGPSKAGSVHFEAAGRGGRGVAPDWDRAAAIARRVPMVLAGGLTPSNVRQAIRRVRPFAVDVSSGVESSPGVKDPDLVRQFVQNVRAESWLESEGPS
jgi:phosphoribosylanthranilate isomerase